MWHELRAEIDLPHPIDEVFDFFSRAENLEAITPDSLGFEIRTPLPIEMRQDVVIDYRIRLGPFPMRWRTLIPVWNPPHEFVDEQIKGPYKTWIHRHSFESIEHGRATRMRDYVRYELPFTPLGDLAHPLIGRQVRSIFAHRNRIIPRLLAERNGQTQAD
jgi:ligand-binding SRPBCC domain-containing protein